MRQCANPLSRSWSHWLCLLPVLTVLLFAFWLMADGPLLVDEIYHYWQIERFCEGKLEVHEDLTNIPGYHVVAATLAMFSGSCDVGRIRGINFLFGLVSIVLFHLCARTLDPGGAVWKTLQFSFLPVLFPFFFLIYTDVFALLLVLGAFLLCLKRRATSSGLVAVLSILVKQTNVAWLGLLFLWKYLDDHGLAVDRKRLVAHLRQCWMMVLGFTSFAVFVVVNRGVALGDRSMHPLDRPHAENLWVLLFLLFFLFLPHLLAHVRDGVALLRRRPYILLVLGALCVLYMLTMIADHPYNNEAADYCLRNGLLKFFLSNPAYKLAFFIPVACSLLFLAVSPPLTKSLWTIHAFTVLYLAPAWLVEPRYYIIPFSLFILARRRAHWGVELAQTVLWLALSLSLLAAIRWANVFP